MGSRVVFPHYRPAAATRAMTVYVDEAQRSPSWPYTWSCHLTADHESELHAFADLIGLKRAWFQGPPGHRIGHYDLTAHKRRTALDAGAVFVPAIEQARVRLAAMKAKKEES